MATGLRLLLLLLLVVVVVGEKSKVGTKELTL